MSDAETTGRTRAVEVLGEFLVVARDGKELYEIAGRRAAADVAYRVADYAEESARHVRLLERALEQLGAVPDEAAALAPGVVRLAPAVRDSASDRNLLEALLLYELRDEIVGVTLEAMARDAPDAEVAAAAGAAALPIQSNEALGAHDSSRHRDRIGYLNEALRARVRSDAGIAE
jgi:hypothetical protein